MFTFMAIVTAESIFEFEALGRAPLQAHQDHTRLYLSCDDWHHSPVTQPQLKYSRELYGLHFAFIRHFKFGISDSIGDLSIWPTLIDSVG